MTDIVPRQFSAAISFVINESTGLEKHDVPRSMHFALLLRGRGYFNRVFSNAVNTNEAFRGPILTRVQDEKSDRSVHAEARAVFRSQVRGNDTSKRARRKTMRQAVVCADGVLVCRLNKNGKLCYSLPCKKCVEVLAKHKIRFVVYSTGDESRPWEKISLQKLLQDERVMPVRKLRTDY